MSTKKKATKKATKATVKLPKWQNQIERPREGSKLAKVWKCIENYYLPNQDDEVKVAWLDEAHNILNKRTNYEALEIQIKRFKRFYSIK